MAQTTAEALKEEGRAQGREEGREEGALNALRGALIRLLRRRFPSVSAEAVRTVENATDADQLNQWLERVVTAESFDEIGLGQRH